MSPSATPDRVTLRPAGRADHDALHALDRRAFSSRTSPGSAPSAGEDFFGAAAPEDHLVLEDGGALLGYVRLGHPTPLPSSRHVVEIRGLAVDPPARRRGLGERLVRAAVAEARRRGALKIALRVLSTNPEAERLYRRCGFELEGHLVGEFLIDGSLVDDRLFAIALGA